MGNVDLVERTQILQRIDQIVPGNIERPDDRRHSISYPTKANHIENHGQSIIKTEFTSLVLLAVQFTVRVSIPQLNYLMRTTSCWKTFIELEEYDLILTAAMENLADTRFIQIS